MSFQESAFAAHYVFSLMDFVASYEIFGKHLQNKSVC